MSHNLRVVRVLVRRAMNEILRVPGAAIPGVLAPTIFLVGIAGVFGKITHLPGFTTDDFHAFIIPLGFLQGAAFSGAATGVNLARDIEQGWFDRLLLAPASRSAILAGTVISASIRSLMPATMLMIIGLAIGVRWPGFSGLAIAVVLFMGMAAAAACWSVTIALRFRSQQAAPLMQVGVFAATLCTTAYAPHDLLTGWLKTITPYNPVTYILEGARQGFVTTVSWADTWPGLLAATGSILFFGILAVVALRRAEV